MESNHEYAQESVTDSRQGIVLHLRGLAGTWQPLAVKETSSMLRNATKNFRPG
jgi:hypothetical protein